AEESDYRRRRLLCVRRERPGRRAAEQRDEVAAFHHSITSSARASRLSGTVRPSAFADLRLITSSYLVGCTTGSSPSPARRYASVVATFRPPFPHKFCVNTHYNDNARSEGPKMRKLLVGLLITGSLCLACPPRIAIAGSGEVAAGVVGGLAVGTLLGAAA